MSETILNGRYEVLRTLHGGMGQVMICADRQSRDQQVVAIKSLLPTDSNEGQAAALVQEAEAWLKLGEAENTFYLGLTRVVSQNDQVFLVMPYCAQGNLRNRMEAAPLSPRDALTFATQILIGLWQLEEAGIIHRDLKPENVLIDSAGRARLSDLGIARFRDEHAIAILLGEARPDDRTSVAGTLPYMAPEQLEGRKSMDSGVDMWAFGVMTIEMLTGRRPFQGRDAHTLVHAIRTASPAGLDNLHPACPPSLPSVLRRLLEKDRRNRFSSFHDVIVAWDDVVRMSSSPDHSGIFRKDRRVLIDDIAVETYWNGALFPERMGSDHVAVRWSFGALKALKDCSEYYKLGRYEKSIDAADIVLRSAIDGATALSRFASATISPRGSIVRTDDQYRSEYVPGADDINAAIDWRTKSAVALLSIPNVDPAFRQEQVAFCGHVLRSPLVNQSNKGLLAQVLALGGEVREAQEILLDIVEDNPADSVAWNALFFTATSTNDMQYARKVAERATSKLTQGRYAENYVLARMWGVLQDWRQAAKYAAVAANEKPDDVETLFMATAALINDGRRSEAVGYYKKMLRVAPDHPKTMRLRAVFPTP